MTGFETGQRIGQMPHPPNVSGSQIWVWSWIDIGWWLWMGVVDQSDAESDDRQIWSKVLTQIEFVWLLQH